LHLVSGEILKIALNPLSANVEYTSHNAGVTCRASYKQNHQKFKMFLKEYTFSI